MEDKLSRKIRAYVNGEAGAEIFDTRDRRHIRVLLKEHQRKQDGCGTSCHALNATAPALRPSPIPMTRRSSRTGEAIGWHTACIVMGCAT